MADLDLHPDPDLDPLLVLLLVPKGIVAPMGRGAVRDAVSSPTIDD